MFDTMGPSVGGRALWAVALMLLASSLAGLGCVADAEPTEEVPREAEEDRSGSSLEERARAIFQSETFQRYLEPRPRSDGELLSVTLVRVSDTGRARDAYDVGYIREERLVFVLPDRPWEARDEASIDVRTEEVFPHPVEQSDGSLVLYQAVERQLLTVLDLSGTPVGTIDDNGNIYRFRSQDSRLERVGFGSPEQAVEKLFGIEARHHIDRETIERVSVEPRVILVPLDGERAQERLDRRLSDGLVRRGRERLAEGLLEEAMADFEQAVELDPQHVEARVGRAEGHQALEDYDAAIRDYEVALIEDETRWDVWVAQALVLAELQRIPDAEDAIREAYRHAPEEALVEVRRAEEQVEGTAR